MYLVFTPMPGAFSTLRLYFWWSYVPSIYTHARRIFYFEVVPLVELCTLHLLACQVHFLLWGCTSGGVMYLVFTPMPGAFSTLRLYLWWSYVPCINFTRVPGAFSTLRLYLWWSYVPCVYLHAGWELLYASQVFIVVFVWYCSSTNQPLFVDSVFYWA